MVQLLFRKMIVGGKADPLLPKVGFYPRDRRELFPEVSKDVHQGVKSPSFSLDRIDGIMRDPIYHKIDSKNSMRSVHNNAALVRHFPKEP